MGVLLAYALLSMLISAHNSRGPEKHKITTTPLKARMWRIAASSSHTEPMGITHDERQTTGFEADFWEQHYSEGLLDCDTLSNILELCTSQFKLLELVCKTANTYMLWKYIPFMSPSQSLTSLYTQSGQDWDQHEARLKSTLQCCGFNRVRVPGNGDCFFISITLALRNQSALTEHLKSKDMDISQDVPVIVSHPRKLMVEELLKNKHIYKDFFPQCYEEEVQKLLQMQYTMILKLVMQCHWQWQGPLIYLSLSTLPLLVIR